jgi:hypothetical protein
MKKGPPSYPGEGQFVICAQNKKDLKENKTFGVDEKDGKAKEGGKGDWEQIMG